MKVIEAELILSELEGSDFKSEMAKAPEIADFIKKRKREIVAQGRIGGTGGGPIHIERKLILKIEIKKTGKTTGEMMVKYFGLVT